LLTEAPFGFFRLFWILETDDFSFQGLAGIDPKQTTPHVPQAIGPAQRYAGARLGAIESLKCFRGIYDHCTMP
jgi:hypothetical protein